MIDHEIYPDFEAIMPFPKCPYQDCGAIQNLDATTYAYWSGILVCDSCGHLFKLKFGDQYESPLDGESIFSPSRRRLITSGRGITLLSGPEPIGEPELLRGLNAPPIPSDIFNDYHEAVMCLATGSSRGAAMLCRHIIQHALLLHGIPDRQPERMIDIAASRPPAILSEAAIRRCRTVTFIGGKASHPQANITESIAKDDARQGILATKRILLELYDPDNVLQ